MFRDDATLNINYLSSINASIGISYECCITLHENELNGE